MESIDWYTHSFIVKVWRERSSRKGNAYTWRGQISHVPDNAQRSIRELSEIVVFIAPYLTQMNIKLGWTFWLFWLLTLRLKPRRRGKQVGSKSRHQRDR